MNIESLTQGSGLSRVTASNAQPQQAARAEAVQLKKNETKELENSPLTVDDQNEASQSALSVEDAIKRLSDFVSPSQSSLSFSVDDVSGRQVVTIVDTQSNEVIRQFPSKEAIAIARALDKLQGLLIKDKA
jgi:flagellar protein FlaG